MSNTYDVGQTPVAIGDAGKVVGGNLVGDTTQGEALKFLREILDGAAMV